MDGPFGGRQATSRKGAEVNLKRTTDGTTALWVASFKGHTEVVKLLLRVNADVNAKVSAAKVSAQGKDYTPLSIAKDMGHTEIVQLLEKAGAKE